MRRAIFLVCLVLGSWRVVSRQSGALVVADLVALVSPKPEFRDQLSRLIAARVAAFSRALVPATRPVVTVQSIPTLVSSHPVVAAQSVPALVVHPVVAVQQKTALVGCLSAVRTTTPAPFATKSGAVRKTAMPVACSVAAEAAPMAPVLTASPRPARVPVTIDPAGPSEDVGVIIAGLGSSAVAPAAALTRSSTGQEFPDQINYLRSARVGAVASPPAPPPVAKVPADPLKVSYASRQLRIDAFDSTLSDILVKVAAVTGVKIEIPIGATRDVLPFVRLGPGPARQVVAALLYGSNFDYVILASATDPDGIENVLLMPREKRGGGADAVAGEPRSPFAAAIVSPSGSDETPASHAPVSTQPDTTADPSAPPPPPPPDAPPPNTSPTSPAALSNRSGLTTEGTQNPPSKLDSQSINQQLQQMYQQRVQQIQEGHPSPAPPPPPANQ